MNYEDTLFPYKVLKKDDEGETITCVQISGQNWKWPKVVDEHVYTPDEIVKRIGEPKSINSRGTFAVPEFK